MKIQFRPAFGFQEHLLMSKRVLVIDDEKLARDRISRFITELNFDFEVIEAESGIDALEKIKNKKPELLLLDIEMPGLTGIEMLQQIEERSFKVIFQTAYDEYAIQAFQENACDYLLKPFNKSRFKEAVDRALADIEIEQKLDNLENKFRERDGYLKRISIRQSGKIKVLELDAVHCFVSQDHYTCIYTTDSEHVCEMSLAHLEKQLDPENFIRCHRNNIVRIDRVQSIGAGENMTIQLPNNMVLPVSRNNRSKVRELIFG